MISLPIQLPVCYIYYQHDLLNNYKLTKSDLFTWVNVASAEGVYMSILHGLLVGFLFPLMGWFFIRESPLPNFFDAEAEAQVELAGSGYGGGNANISGGDGDGGGGGDGSGGRQGGLRARAEGSGPIGSGNSTGGANLRQGEQNRDQDQREDRLNMRAQTASASNANANDELGRQVSARVAANFAVGGMTVPTMIFGKRMQVSLFLTFGTEKKVYV